MANPRVAPRSAPLPVPPDARLSAAQSVFSASLRVTASCLKLLAQQQKTLGNRAGRRRAEDGAGTERRRPSGACLTDGYGRRCTDVDVERL